MVKRMFGAVLLGLLTLLAEAQQGDVSGSVLSKATGWHDDFAKATRESAALQQPVFALFTGSDWCPVCVTLSQEVLQKQAFKTFAANSLILFEADFPRDKRLPEKVEMQNAALAERYGVTFFPTVFLLDASGKVLAQTGYLEGGVEAYVKHLKELLDQAGVKVGPKAPSAAQAEEKK